MTFIHSGFNWSTNKKKKERWSEQLNYLLLYFIFLTREQWRAGWEKKEMKIERERRRKRQWALQNLTRVLTGPGLSATQHLMRFGFWTTAGRAGGWPLQLLERRISSSALTGFLGSEITSVSFDYGKPFLIKFIISLVQQLGFHLSTLAHEYIACIGYYEKDNILIIELLCSKINYLK